MQRLALSGLVSLILAMALPAVSLAETFASPRFEELWASTDAPVARGEIYRAWVWGPVPIGPGREEPYAEAPGGQRLVQYFDKGRMELNDPAGPVTAGLLARELVTGKVQTGDSRFEQRAPAALGIVGDPDDTLGPTYATFGPLLERPPHEAGAAIAEVVGRDGSIGADLVLARYGVRAGELVPETNHRLATVFQAYFDGPLPPDTSQPVPRAPFAPWWSVTGLPISEAYWTRARVGTIVRDVLVQVFERRVLTYTPANPPEWQVEMGNIGQHYLAWRAAPAAPPVMGGLPCPTVQPPPLAEKPRSQFVILGSALHEAGGQRAVSGMLRNDGSTAGPVEVVVVRLNAAGEVLGRSTTFSDRDLWPGGQVAAFRVELPADEPLADWRIELRHASGRPSGGLASGFAIAALSGEVGGFGIGRVTGTVRYTGMAPFTNVAVVRIYALDACGSVVTHTFASLGLEAITPGSSLDFSSVLLGAEGAVQLRAVVEARTGTGAIIPADALRVYQGTLAPAPLIPITAVDGCCQYTRAYSRPDGTPVRSIFRLTNPAG